jgi:ribonuclease VapC
VIIDTSALVAIFFKEPESESFADIIRQSQAARISVVNRLEFAIVISRRGGPDSERRAELTLAALNIVEEPVTLGQGLLARHAFLDYGKGRHVAGLNFGDCFAYALAKAMNEPLLYKGSDFAQTDVIPAYSSDR